MKIARILYPVHVLGPGERVAIWTYGCIHACPGCANPELWHPADAKETESGKLKQLLEQLLQRGPIDGVTITGGDPFLYPESLQEILQIAGQYTEDILVYTGYRLAEVQKLAGAQEILEQIAVLIDGTYEEKRNNGHVLKGSDNQNIYYLKKHYQAEYEAYIAEHQGKYPVENFPAKGGVISAGIHKPDFGMQFQSRGSYEKEQKQNTTE
ncbi:MAG: 4Fe-4S cluster-binding domain-containing protein [Lachnospiraceae bacterium]|nr:4Fe-4S cluster-binding domain-containing protein [Lachnospiraceae bacterium]